VVILTLVLLASGVALLLASPAWSRPLLFVHKASFVLWFCVMTVHVLGHLAEVARVAPRDWLRRTRGEVGGAGSRQWLIAASLVTGALLGLAMLSRIGPWLASAHSDH
jgi:H+/Cl- antiporter ClcA